MNAGTIPSSRRKKNAYSLATAPIFWHELADDFNRLNEKLGGAVLTNAKDVAIDPENSEKQTIVAPVNMQVESSNTFDNHTQNATH